jgi:hypothetical protein
MADIRKLVAKHLGKQKQLGITAATLTLRTRGTRTVGSEAAGTNPASVSYSCKAFVEPVSKMMDGSLVTEGHSVLSILGGTLPSGVVPRPVSSTIVRDGITYKVVKVIGDPVGAIYQCEVAH